MILTAAQVKQRFRQEGLTIKRWSEERGYDPLYVTRVLNGIVKGNFGQGHEIAVALGLKADKAAA